MSTKTDELMRLAGNCRECYAYYLSVPASKKPAAKREMDESDAALSSAIQEVVRDAERYQWLRQQHEESDSAESFCVFAPIPAHSLEPVGCMPGELDAAIDAAMQPEPPEAT